MIDIQTVSRAPLRRGSIRIAVLTLYIQYVLVLTHACGLSNFSEDFKEGVSAFPLSAASNPHHFPSLNTRYPSDIGPHSMHRCMPVRNKKGYALNICLARIHGAFKCIPFRQNGLSKIEKCLHSFPVSRQIRIHIS